MWIRDEIDMTQRHSKRKRLWLALLAVLVLFLLRRWLWRWDEPHQAASPGHVVTMSDIVTSIEAEWRIQGKDTISVTFPLSEQLTAVYVEPWDRVDQGELLAQIDPRAYQIALRRHQTTLDKAYQSSQAATNPLNTTERASLDQQVALQQLALDQTRIQTQQRLSQGLTAQETAQLTLDQLEKDLKDLIEDDDVDLVSSDIDVQLQTATANLSAVEIDIRTQIETLLDDADQILGISITHQHTNDAYEVYLGAQNSLAKNQATSIWSRLMLWSDDLTVSISDAIDLARSMQDVLTATIPTVALDAWSIAQLQSVFRTHASILTQKQQALVSARNSIESIQSSSIGRLDSVADARQDAIDTLQAQIRTARVQLDQASRDVGQIERENPVLIDTATATLRKTQLDIQNMKSPLSSSEISLQNLQISTAKIGIEEAQYSLDKTKLIAPKAGTILTVNQVVGEYPGPDFISMAIDASKYIEVLIEEEEVNNLYVWQPVDITLDALEDTRFTGEIYYVSSAGQRDRNDIVQYQILIQYDDQDSRIRSEMTVNADFIIERVEDILVVPVSYITKEWDQDWVTISDDQLVPVELGLSDGTSVHVLSGLDEGDVILLPSDQ